jgi:predicted ATPase
VAGHQGTPIRTPDQRVRVFVSSTLGELAREREAVRGAIEWLRLTPVMFEVAARPHPPRALYRAYLQQSDVFVGVYWQRYGWVAPGEDVSGLEDEYRLATGLPQLVYIKEPAPERELRLTNLISSIQKDDRVSYRRFSSVDELNRLVQDDLALLLSERFHPISVDERAALARPPSASPPGPLDATLGREADVDALASMLRRGDRWVTLTGAGGIGKSRLALEVARTVSADFPGGVVFVPLDAVTDPSLVLPTIARRLGARREGGDDLLDAAAEAVGDERTLILTDNFEQVAPAAPDLLALLDYCPPACALVTSRHVLRVRGEREYQVPCLGENSAVDLFTDRAASVRPGFALTEENRAVVSEICRRLDGLPLAIELAAARLRLLSPDALLAQLAERMDLDRGAVDLPSRQRTMRATMDWSYDLLTATERAVFARLAVFSGGWSIEAARAVCEHPNEPDVQETLSGLLEKSLILTTAGDPTSELRMRMLEPVRAYAAERLAESPDQSATKDRHTAWMLGFMHQAVAGVDSPAHKQWMERLDQERPNLRAAVRRSLDAGDLVDVARLLRDGFLYLHFRDAEHEAIGWLDDALRCATEADTTRGRLLAIRALATTSLGDYATARSLMREGRSLVPDDKQNAVEQAMLALTDGICASVDEPADVAMPAMNEAVRRYAALRDELSLALCEVTMGGIALRAGDLDGAGRHYRAALAFADEVDSDPLRGHALTLLGMVALTAGRGQEATGLLCDAARVNRNSGQPSTTAYSVEVLAAALLAADNPELAARALAAATAARTRIGRPPWGVYVPLVDDLTVRLRSSLSHAEYQAAGAEGSEWTLTDALDRALEALESA